MAQAAAVGRGQLVQMGQLQQVVMAVLVRHLLFLDQQ
jgi:hypothetical protein